MYFVAEQTEQRSGSEVPGAPGFAHGICRTVRGTAKKRMCAQGLKVDSCSEQWGNVWPEIPVLDVCHVYNYPVFVREFE
jgi:hypothetical protein